MENVRLRVNAPQVIHETINGEVIIINLASGNYYSVKGAGADVWEAIQASPGAGSKQIVASIAGRFDRPPDAIEPEIRPFIEELMREELVAEVEDGVASSPPATNGTAPVSGESRPFERPVLEKYTDMQDLVLLDPVHEVDSAGWPSVRPDVPAA